MCATVFDALLDCGLVAVATANPITPHIIPASKAVGTCSVM